MQNRFLIRLILMCLLVFAAGYFIGYHNASDEARRQVKSLLERR